MKKLFVSVLLVMMVIFMLDGCSEKPSEPATSEKTDSKPAAMAEQPAQVLTIGEIETLTGHSSDNLKLAADGGKMAMAYINSHGGITVNGQKYTIEILLEDNKGNPDGAAAAANKLVYDKKVKFIAGGAQGFINLAIASVTEPAGVLYVAEFNNGAKAELNASTPLKFFANSDSFSSQYAAMAYLKKIHPEAKTIIFIQIDDGNFNDIEPVAKATAQKLGLEILGNMVGYTPAMVDMSPIIQKVLALNPDAIMIGNGPTGFTAQILKGARVAGYTQPIFSCSNAPPQDILTIVGKEVATNYFGFGITVDYDIPNLPPITKEIMQMAEKDFGLFNFEQTHGFNAVYTLVEAIEAAQSLDPKDVAAAWEKMDTIGTIYGEGKMGGMETYGLKHNVYFDKPVIELEDGNLKFGDWMPAYMP